MEPLFKNSLTMDEWDLATKSQKKLLISAESGNKNISSILRCFSELNVPEAMLSVMEIAMLEVQLSGAKNRKIIGECCNFFYELSHRGFWKSTNHDDKHRMIFQTLHSQWGRRAKDAVGESNQPESNFRMPRYNRNSWTPPPMENKMNIKEETSSARHIDANEKLTPIPGRLKKYTPSEIFDSAQQKEDLDQMESNFSTLFPQKRFQRDIVDEALSKLPKPKIIEKDEPKEIEIPLPDFNFGELDLDAYFGSPPKKK